MQREWIQRYNGPANSFDIVSGIFCTQDGGCIVYGSENGIGTGLDFCVIRYDKSGNMIWNASYNGSGNETDQLNKATPDDSGNVYVTGFNTNEELEHAITVGKITANGNFAWTISIEEPGFDFGMGSSICITSSGNIALAGNVRDSLFHSRILLAEVSPTGNVIRKTVMNNPDNARVVEIENIGEDDLVILFEGEFGANSFDISVAKYGNQLNRLWMRSFNGSASGNDRASDMFIDQAERIYVTGSKWSGQSKEDCYTVCLSSAGTVLWENLYQGEFSDIPGSIFTDLNGNSFVTGSSSTGSTVGTEDIYTIKINPNGETVWGKRYNGAGNGIDRANSVLTDEQGNVYVAGYSDIGGVHVAYAFLKMDSAGNVIYSDFYSVSPHPEDFGYALSMDATGNIYMTGISSGITTDYDFATIKYSEAVGIFSNNAEVPNDVRLFQNYPNPFNPKTIINYELRIKNFVSLKVYDITGQEVATLVNDIMPAGRHAVEFNAEEFSSGVYFYSVYLDGIYSDSKKMILLK